jgi:osmotically-inducible protein OsmY
VNRRRESRESVLPEAGVGASGGGPPAGGYPEEPRTDQQIAEGVRVAFFLEPDFEASQFHVEANGGVVRLGGVVRDEAERGRAIEIAAGVSGVSRVVDELVIEPRR